MADGKILYQVKVILDYLPKEEYDLIPKETIEYIEDNFEYDEKFSIDPSVPLEKQKIGDKAYKILDQIIKSVQMPEENKKPSKGIRESEQNNQSSDSSSDYDIRIENIRLKNLIEMLQKENNKIQKARDLLLEYQNALKSKDDEIERLKKNNQELYDCIQRLPKFIKNIFMKDLNIKSLNN